MTNHKQKVQQLASAIVARMFDSYPSEQEAYDIIKERFPEPQEKVCRWNYFGNEMYKIDCNGSVEHKLLRSHYCPYCGGKIV